MSVAPCCLQGFAWGGTPVGREDKLGQNDAYITGDNPDRGILYIHDLLGWKFPNARLLADHFAQEANATVYVVDFFGGEQLPYDDILNDRWDKLDVHGFIANHSRAIREPEIFECARLLRSKHKKVGAIGYCYGGWAVLRLAAKEHQPPLVDCVSMAHPSMMIAKDLDEVAMPIQILAPEHDPAYTPELKMHTFETLYKSGLRFDYQHFPGVVHGCFIRGDPNKPGEQASVVNCKNAAVSWFKEHL